jgi:hypothetical protein
MNKSKRIWAGHIARMGRKVIAGITGRKKTSTKT